MQTENIRMQEPNRRPLGRDNQMTEESTQFEPAVEVVIDKAGNDIRFDHRRREMDFDEGLHYLGKKAVNFEDQIGDKIEDFGHNIIDFGAKTIDVAANVGTKIFNSTVNTVHSVEHEVKDKGVVGATKELVEHGIDSLKKGYVDFVSFMTKSPQEIGKQKNQEQIEISKKMKEFDPELATIFMNAPVLFKKDFRMEPDFDTELETIFVNAPVLFEADFKREPDFDTELATIFMNAPVLFEEDFKRETDFDTELSTIFMNAPLLFQENFDAELDFSTELSSIFENGDLLFKENFREREQPWFEIVSSAISKYAEMLFT
jgi:hypothetical protein